MGRKTGGARYVYGVQLRRALRIGLETQSAGTCVRDARAVIESPGTRVPRGSVRLGCVFGFIELALDEIAQLV